MSEDKKIKITREFIETAFKEISEDDEEISEEDSEEQEGDNLISLGSKEKIPISGSNEIAKSFNKILNGIHHHRIDYPEEVARINGKSRKQNGNSDRRQATSLQDRTRGNKEKGKDNLRRLGMS